MINDVLFPSDLKGLQNYSEQLARDVKSELEKLTTQIEALSKRVKTLEG
jgi:hypothetical protein